MKLRIACAAFAVLAFLTVPARADLLVYSPGFVYNAGLLDLAADFTRQTGVKVTVRSVSMGTVLNQIKTATPPADVVVLPMEPFNLLGTLALDKGIKQDTFKPIGRVEIALAVKAGAPRPDISTVEKLATVLRNGGTIMRSNPAGGSMSAGIIDRMLKRPEFAGVHSQVSTNGEGGEALVRGEGDMALQLICEVVNHPEISLVNVLPPELNAHMDGAVAVSARTTDEKNARAFVAFITRPQTAPIWKAKGLNMF